MAKNSPCHPVVPEVFGRSGCRGNIHSQSDGSPSGRVRKLGLHLNQARDTEWVIQWPLLPARRGEKLRATHPAKISESFTSEHL